MTKKRSREIQEARAKGLFQSGKIERELRRYVRYCHEVRNDAMVEDGEREEIFPNLAGFCRYLGIGLQYMTSLGEEYPKAYDGVMTLLEDEALNATRLPANSASLTAAYFKRRLGYDGEREMRKENDEVQVLFEHDIWKAGA